MGVSIEGFTEVQVDYIPIADNLVIKGDQVDQARSTF